MRRRPHALTTSMWSVKVCPNLSVDGSGMVPGVLVVSSIMLSNCQNRKKKRKKKLSKQSGAHTHTHTHTCTHTHKKKKPL